jgi:hypothetical protein
MTSFHNPWRRSLAVCTLLAVFGIGLGSARAAADREGLTPEQFARLHALLKPQPGESKWAEIPWLTNLQEARQRVVAEDKPLFVWRAGGGDPLGRV